MIIRWRRGNQRLAALNLYLTKKEYAMDKFGSFLLSVILIVSSSPLSLGQTPGSQPQDLVRVRSNEVKLDVVVKDKKGHPVKDLTQGDFEIYEDGVPQQIQSFRFVMREAATVVVPEQKETKAG